MRKYILQNKFALTALLFMFAVMLRSCFCGISYEPILDDSIQYISYPSSQNYGTLIAQEGLFASRPLAVLIDLFFVGQMNGALIVPVLIFSAMHGLSAVLFARLFGKYFNTSAVFCAVYALLPLGVEGTYWLSASSRIVTGLFFTALAAYVLDSFIERGGAWRLPVLFVLQLLSIGFYEQILVLSFVLSVLIFIKFRREKRAGAAFISILAVAVYFAFTAANKGDGALGSRMEIVLPTTGWYFDTFLPDLWQQIVHAFIAGGIKTTFVGLIRGIALSVQSLGGVIFMISAAGLGVLCYLLLRRKNEKNGDDNVGSGDNNKVVSLNGWGGALVWGILLFAAPIAPFFVIANPYFSLRATVPSFVGAALLIDLVIRVIFRRVNIISIICGVFVFCFIMGGASEVYDYRRTAKTDSELASLILEHADEMSGRVGFFGGETYYFEDQNYPYHEHISGICSSEWALYGKLVAEKGGELGFSTVPLVTKDFCFYHGWNTDMKRLSGFDQLWLWENGELSKLSWTIGGGEHDRDLYRVDGTLYAHVWEENDYGYISFPETE